MEIYERESKILRKAVLSTQWKVLPKTLGKFPALLRQILKNSPAFCNILKLSLTLSGNPNFSFKS